MMAMALRPLYTAHRHDGVSIQVTRAGHKRNVIAARHAIGTRG
jgi:hypothetical protein